MTIAILLIVCSCERESKPETKQQSNSKIHLDTARIKKALRDFDALPPQTRNKAVMLQKILDTAILMGYNDEACFLNMDLARGQVDRGNFDSTLYYFNRARPYCEKPLFDKTIPAVFLTEFGAFYHSLQSDHAAANKCYYDALNYLKENNLSEHEICVAIYIYLYGTQEKLGHHQQALQYLKEGEHLARRINSTQGLLAMWWNFGDYHALRKNYDTAIHYYDKAIAGEKDIWDPNILTAPLIGKASVLTKTGDPHSAIVLLERALKISKNNQIIYSEVGAIIGLGAAYNKLKRYRQTIAEVTPALTKQEKGFNNDKEEGYRVVMEAYEGLGDYKAALEMQRRLYAWRDSLTNIQKTSELNELELKFQTANKDKEIAAKHLLIEKQRNTLSGKNMLIIGISAAAVLTLLTLFYLYKNASHKKNVKELELKSLRDKQELEILKSTMQGEEQERQRLSRELHDGIGSMISSAIMHFSSLKNKNPQDVTSKDYDEVLQLLQDTGNEVRKTAQNLMPDTLYKQTLFEAVKSYCDSITRGTTLKIDVQFYGVSEEFAPHCKLVIYRVIQELVHNIVRHSKATHGIVQGMMNDDRFSLTIEDNGVGFDLAVDKKRMGLKNVQSRVKSLYGEYNIESTPDKGTSVYMDFDCKRLYE